MDVIWASSKSQTFSIQTLFQPLPTDHSMLFLCHALKGKLLHLVIKTLVDKQMILCNFHVSVAVDSKRATVWSLCIKNSWGIFRNERIKESETKKAKEEATGKSVCTELAQCSLSSLQRAGESQVKEYCKVIHFSQELLLAELPLPCISL